MHTVHNQTNGTQNPQYMLRCVHYKAFFMQNTIRCHMEILILYLKRIRAGLGRPIVGGGGGSVPQ